MDRTSLYLGCTVHEVENEFNKSIGKKLRALRREAGLSQRSLAQKMELSHQQIQKYERGDNALPLERVKPFASALGVDAASLVFPEINWRANKPVAILSPDRAELLRLYDALPDRESQKLILDLLRTTVKLMKTPVRSTLA